MSRISLCFAAIMLACTGSAQEPQNTVFELSCPKVCPNPVYGCNGCQVAVLGCEPSSLKQKSSVTWRAIDGQAWTVRFKGKSPCQQKKFDGQHPVCQLTGQPGTYKYAATITGCARRISGSFTVF
jgi:hypothetical protein